MDFLELISQPWHWSISGFLIACTMFLLLLLGGEFGVSSNLRTMCTMCGAGKQSDFFNFNWKTQIWNLIFIGGAIIGGFIASHYLSSPEPVLISTQTQESLAAIGIETPTTLSDGHGFVPDELYDLGSGSLSFKLIFLIIGGFMVGFGTRWAGGCTSGHAISGLSNFQLPSLIAVIGFFIGGLIMTWLILPLLLNL